MPPVISFRHAGALIGAALSIAAIAYHASAPKPALFAWADIQVVLFPDTADGTLIVMSQMVRGRPQPNTVSFASFVDPDSAKTWIPVARAFLGLPTPGVDTSHVAVSLPLTGSGGESMAFARRRTDSGWTADRYLIVRPRASAKPQIINLSPQSASEFLDSLTAVVVRTPLPTANPQSQRAALIASPDTGACPARDSPTPRYPADERNSNMDGHVVASFVVTERGRVDEKTAVIVFASAPGFARAVRAALRDLRFDPARHSGAAVPQRVVMPFMFTLTRPGDESWSPPKRDRPYEACA